MDAATLERDRDLECDVAIVGSGAGGAITAQVLTLAGLRVAIVEEGPLASSSEFRMREGEAYVHLYQESGARKTVDSAISILQGRCVGGSTTVNWTSSFRAPPATLAHWRSAHGLRSMDEAALAPWYERIEAALAIAPWTVAPNENNDALRRGCEALGFRWGTISRNVRGCWNLGYCGMGCPTNAKQSMLLTAIPAALDKGALLVHRARVERLRIAGGRVEACEASGVAASGAAPGSRVRIRARHYVLAAGAIGSPAILLRSAAPDPHGTAGRRTFLHPTVASVAAMPQPVRGWSGAPQSVYSDHFLDGPLDGPAGFKLESAPVHPLLAAITLPGFGEEHARRMAGLANRQVLIALVRDGFHAASPGGRVVLRDDGSAGLDYRMTPYLWEAARRAWLAMARIQLAAGAREVLPVHEAARAAGSWEAARHTIEGLELRPLAARVMSAHVMGGCAMGTDPRVSVVDEGGRHHHLANLSVHDGSIFPTSLGANPQLTIYALAARLSDGLARSLA
ncbi:MAG TPA: GMC family oxidoreductase [Usitatibacter sp.]|nr:GMC family oxidoreductase [Usitatibacter sp.]